MLARLTGPLLAAALLATALVAPGGSTTGRADAPVALGDVQTVATATDTYEARLLYLVNLQRARRGLVKLRVGYCVDGYAERWAVNLLRKGYLYHQSLYPILRNCHATLVGENIGYGNVSADRMMAMWMASAGHRANILNPRFRYIGLGAVRSSSGRWYAVQDFMRY